MASLDTLICPTDCVSTLPPFSFNDCNPTYLQSQVDYVYLMNVGYPLADWTSPSEWATRLALTTEANAIRRLHVIGEVPAPTSNVKKVPGGVKYSPKTFVMNVDIYDISDDNYDAARATGCNGQYLMYYSILGGRMFYAGVPVGVKIDPVITKNDEDDVLLVGAFQWTSQFIPQMIANPIA